MPRPVIPRHVGFIPDVVYFKPAGVPLRQLEVVLLDLSELEALRLKDHTELDQEECARLMRISRPTFQRILVSARRKVADALVTGKAIRVENVISSPGNAATTLPSDIHSTVDGYCPACDLRGKERHQRHRHGQASTDD